MSSSFLRLAAFTADKADLKKVYDTANFYHFIHTVALLAVPLSRKPVLVSFGVLNHGYSCTTCTWVIPPPCISLKCSRMIE